eukprot:gb/GEZN01006590.1/.p1 GENE.gb/GEZN01006590.1/~~gb/GEZN01006590.1/.p1  ORF type:complete len:279 (-),score=50.69 gb/GEZN01006590.1/:693-1529(-)
MSEEWREAYSDESGKYYYYHAGATSWVIPGTNWRKMKDKKSMRDYYVDVNTKVTSWKLPDGVTVPTPPSRLSVVSRPAPMMPDPRASDASGLGSGTMPPPASPMASSMVIKEEDEHEEARAASIPSLPAGGKVDQAESKEFVDSAVPDAVEAKKKGNDFFHLKDYKNALVEYSKAVTADPACANLYFNRSATYYCLKDLDGALKDAEKAVELAPKNPSALARLGFTFLKLQKLPEAYQAYTKAVAIDPVNKRCVQGLEKVKKVYNPDKAADGASPDAI